MTSIRTSRRDRPSGGKPGLVRNRCARRLAGFAVAVTLVAAPAVAVQATPVATTTPFLAAPASGLAQAAPLMAAPGTVPGGPPAQVVVHADRSILAGFVMLLLLGMGTLTAVMWRSVGQDGSRE